MALNTAAQKAEPSAAGAFHRDFYEWRDENADRIWNALRLSNQRDLSFNQFAYKMWQTQ